MVKPEDRASFINDFFVNIGPSLAEKCKSDWVYNGATANNQLLDILTNEEEVFFSYNFHKETLQGNPLVFRRSTWVFRYNILILIKGSTIVYNRQT